MNQPLAPARAVRLVHAVLTAGVTVIAVMFAVLVPVIAGPRLPDSPFIGYALAGVGLASVIAALTGLRPRVPERPRDHSADEYWSDPAVRGSTLLLWAVVEGGGLAASIGYVLTQVLAAVAVAGLSIIVLLLMRPSRLEGVT